MKAVSSRHEALVDVAMSKAPVSVLLDCTVIGKRCETNSWMSYMNHLRGGVKESFRVISTNLTNIL